MIPSVVNNITTKPCQPTGHASQGNRVTNTSTRLPCESRGPESVIGLMFATELPLPTTGFPLSRERRALVQSKCDCPATSRVPSRSSRGAQRRGDLVAAKETLLPPRDCHAPLAMTVPVTLGTRETGHASQGPFKVSARIHRWHGAGAVRLETEGEGKIRQGVDTDG